MTGGAWPFEYFDARMLNRQRLLWAIATRRQLERWEPLVAAAVLRDFERRQLDDADTWVAAIEHHLALIAARHLLRALELPPAAGVAVDPTMRAELIEGRDLHEHWNENVPVFNVWPRVEAPPRPSGKSFAARNPKDSPYDWLAWSNTTGAQLLPNVSAPALHELLDAVEAEVLADAPELGSFVPPREPAPWTYGKGEWWPKP